MSETNSFNKKINLKSDELIAIQDIVLEYILSNGWKDYEGFARKLSETILRRRPKTEQDLIQCIGRFTHPFYSFIGVSKKEFLKRFPVQQVIQRLSNMPKQPKTQETVVVIAPPPKPKPSHITFAQIFPEIEKMSIEEAKQLLGKLDMPERVIQNALRTALREKGATNIAERKSDTSLEVADLEDFSLKIGRQWYSFVSVVKGYDSLRKPRVRWEDVAHQVTKAYQGTQPNHVLLILAKNPVDGLITQLVSYGKTVGNRHLVILVEPIDLARFLHARQLI